MARTIDHPKNGDEVLSAYFVAFGQTDGKVAVSAELTQIDGNGRAVGNSIQGQMLTPGPFWSVRFPPDGTSLGEHSYRLDVRDANQAIGNPIVIKTKPRFGGPVIAFPVNPPPPGRAPVSANF